MLYEIINKDRLMRYKQYVSELNTLYERKHQLEQTMGLSSYDFSKIKVTTNKRRLTEEEQFVIRLEKINRKISEIEPIVRAGRLEFESQIERIAHLDWRYKEILQSYYVDNVKAKEIVITLFGNSEPESWKQFYRLQKAALRELQKVSKKPFIEIEQQLVLEV